MRYVATLLENGEYQKTLDRLEQLEAGRNFCRHNMVHFMDVARLAWIRNMEQQFEFDKEMIYLYALLHDIGRVAEYEKGISHAQASADYAGEILAHIGYDKQKMEQICDAIAAHRNSGDCEWKDDFTSLMKWADKASRMCFACKAAKDCNWSTNKRNHTKDWM